MGKVELPLERLNDALDGGIEPGSNVLLLVDLVINKAEFAAALTNFRVEEGDDIVYYLNNKMPEYITDRLDTETDQVSLIDGFSATLDKDSDSDYRIAENLQENRKDYLEEAKKTITTALKDDASSFIVDSMDPFVGNWGEIEDVLGTITPVAEKNDVVSYYLLPNLGFDEDGDEMDRMKQNFDYVFHLKGLERSGLIMKFIEVMKPEVETKVPYDTTPTGLAMYVPKILVTGPTNSGKTETVHTLSDTSVSAEGGGTTVALDNGQVHRKGIKADIFGTPGEKRFDWAMNFLGKSIFGAFIVVDSRDPDYERAKQIRDNLGEKQIPLIVLANFQNKDDAIEPEKIGEEIGLETIGVDAKHGDNLEESMDRLMDKIMESHSWYD